MLKIQDKCILEIMKVIFLKTVEPVLKDLGPIGHKHMVCQCSITNWNLGAECQKYLLFQDRWSHGSGGSSLLWQWSHGSGLP